MRAEKRRWREWRGSGWGQTVYQGLYIGLGLTGGILISKLSHGLRVLEIQGTDRYLFESTDCQLVEVPEEFFNEAMIALAADRRFQGQLAEYERLWNR